MITERTLKKWRREALIFEQDIKGMEESEPILSLCIQVIRMTQELLDQHLLRRDVR